MAKTRKLLDSRYTATIEMIKVDRYQPTDRNGHAIEGPLDKEQTDSRITVRAGTMHELQNKVVAHIQLMDEDDLTKEEYL